jgi:NAD(P)-dependent dehydrogenase (short-subunit alcohol dehydrogenase family)
MASSSNALAYFRLDGKLAVITGGASGIGCATSELFAAAGARVAVADRDAEAAARSASAIGGNALALGLDVSDEPAVEAAFRGLAENEGGIDVVICNAGMNIRTAATSMPRADWDRVVAVNLSGTFFSARAAARQMIARGKGGAIVMTASIMSFSGGGLYPNIAYQTTKGALVNMTRGLAVEWAPHNIRVNAVAPTWVNTPFIKPILDNAELMARIKAMTPLGRIAEASEVAHAMLFLASPAAAMITGHTLPVDGGFLAQ